MSYHGAGNGNPDASSHYDVVGAVPRLVAPVLGGVPRLVAPTLGALPAQTANSRAQFATKAAGQAVDFKSKLNTKRSRRPPARMQRDGKVKVEVSSVWSDMNAVASDLLKPLYGMIDALPNHIASRTVKNKWKTRPLDAQMDMIDPIEHALARAINRVLARKGNVQSFFGDMRDLRLVQAVDLKTDTSTQNLMRRLRVAHAFYVLMFAQPIDFAAELLKEGIDVAGSMAAAAGQVAADIAKQAGETVEKAAEEAGKAAKTVASWFGLGSAHGLGSYGGLGEPATAATAGLVAALTPVVGAGMAEFLAWVIMGITASIIAAVGVVIAATGTAGAAVVSAGGAVAVSMVSRSGGALETAVFGPKPAPKASPTAVAPAAAPPPPAPSGGVSPLVILGGAAAVAFLFLRK